MHKSSFFLLFLILLGVQLDAQKFFPLPPMTQSQVEVDKVFRGAKMFSINVSDIQKSLQRRGNQQKLHLDFDGLVWDLDLFEFDMMSSDYKLLIGRDGGVDVRKKDPNLKFYRGYNRSSDNGVAFIAVSNGFLLGSVRHEGKLYLIEPARYTAQSAAENQFLVYSEEMVIPHENVSCAYDMYKSEMDKHRDSGDDHAGRRAGCVSVEAALANDMTIFTWQGNNSTNVENWCSGILALVETNYDTEFSTDVEMSVSAIFVATSSGSDPWNTVNNINTHLNTHLSWANGGGYGGASYDFATAWTRKYTSGAVGLAWVAVVCTSNRYNVCSAYTTASGTLRQLQAHEVGHNFGAGHDASGSPYIMAPAVNGSSTWSSASITDIDNHINSRWCLDPCSSGTPPTAGFSADPKIGCAPLKVTFRDLSIGAPTSWLWTFDGGSPATSTAQNPVVTYSTGGLYSVTLKVTNGYGDDETTTTDYIQVYDAVVPYFEETIDGRTVYFNNQSLFGDTYRWEFGDNTYSNEEHPVHDYLKDGTYTVKLKVTNFCGTKEYVKKIIIVTPPVPDFEADTIYGCTPLTIRFKNLSSNNVTRYEWDFPGGEPNFSTSQNPVITYKYSDSFSVKLTVVNTNYTVSKYRKNYIYVDTIPKSAFDFNPTGLNVNFIENGKRGKNYKWDFGDGGTSILKNPDYTYSASGTYRVRLITANSCGSDTSYQNVTVTNGLYSAFESNDNNSCAPATVHFTNKSPGATTFKWTFPGGIPASSTDPNPTILYQNAGSYNVSLEVSDGVDSKVSAQQDFVKIKASPVSSFDFSVKAYKVTFNDLSTGASSYEWAFGDQTFSNLANPTHEYGAEGEYQVSLKVTNECGTHTYNEIVAVYLVPKVDFSSSTITVCAGKEVQFNDKSSRDVVDWSWQFGGGVPALSTDKNPSVTYWKAGLYTVKLAVKNSNGTNSVTKTNYIKVLSPIRCPEYSSEYKESGDVDGDPIVDAKPREVLSNRWSIVPNPNFGNFNIISEASVKGNVEFEMYDLFGKMVYKNLISDQNQVSIDQEQLSGGTYLLKIKHGSEVSIHKVFVQK